MGHYWYQFGLQSRDGCTHCECPSSVDTDVGQLTHRSTDSVRSASRAHFRVEPNGITATVGAVGSMLCNLEPDDVHQQHDVRVGHNWNVVLALHSVDGANCASGRSNSHLLCAYITRSHQSNCSTDSVDHS